MWNKPLEYALANRVEHPRSVYVREELIVPTLDHWLAQAFEPAHLADTLTALTTAQHTEQATAQQGARAQARRVLAERQAKLARYRAALEAGTGPALVAGWTAEVTAQRAHAQARLRAAEPPRPISRDHPG